ncbi:MAG: enoyl-CoA hydratase/isomerase family protein [Pseudomonadota bacterium]
MALWTTDLKDGVLVATYNNPPMNYFCAEGVAELAGLIATWDSPEIRVIVITGAVEGRFITHYSVEELVDLANDQEAMQRMGTALNDGYHALLLSLRHLPVPVIMAMNGDAQGGGFEFSLMGDIRVLQKGDHRVGLPEIKLGIMPGGSGTQFLPRLIGMGQAINFIVRGQTVPPEEALSLGLVHELADNALARAKEIAAELAKQPRHGMAMAKRAVLRGADLPLTDGLRTEAEAFLSTMLDEDALHAMKTYLDQPLEARRDWLSKGGLASG